MKPSIIHNRIQLETSAERKLLLDLVEHGLDAINTANSVRSKLKLKKNTLWAGEYGYELSEYDRIFVIGFGKSSGKAALEVERLLGDKISDGVVISLEKEPLTRIKSFVGTHPLPSLQNVSAAIEIRKLLSDLSEKDLVICLVSGGGSALLCWDEEELEQNTKAYNEFLKVGQDIKELNLVRKHISKVKGGGLASMLYPAEVLSLVFCDVPGQHFELVASGPTYPPSTSMYDAKQVLEKYHLGGFRLFDHPNEKKYFQKIQNLQVVSELDALTAMKERCEELGFPAKIRKTSLTTEAPEALKTLREETKPGEVMLVGSEIKVIVTKTGGNGGRCQYLGMSALLDITSEETFAFVASDGLDNSDCAGVVVDFGSKHRAENLNLNIKEYLNGYKGYDLFSELGHEQLFTGPTGSNVSDFIVYYKKRR